MRVRKRRLVPVGWQQAADFYPYESGFSSMVRCLAAKLRPAGSDSSTGCSAETSAG